MSFTDADRERLRNVLKNEDSVREFFTKNREHLTSNMNKIKETTERRSREIKGVMDASKGFEMMGLISTATLKTMSDITDVIEISLLNSIEAQKEIIGTLSESSSQREKQITELKDKYDEIRKHKTNMEWIAKYFERSSVTTPE
jgi:hypothetical protein